MTIFGFDAIPDDPTTMQDGGERPKPGKGMAIITKWDEYAARTKGASSQLDLEIVAWTDPACVGMRHTEQIFTKDSTGKGHPQKRLTTLAMAAGLFTPADVVRWKKNGQQAEVDMNSLVGRPIMIALIEEPDKNDPDKKYIKIGGIGLAMYHITDPRVKGWPMNQSIYTAKLPLVGTFQPPSAAVASPPQQKPSTPSIRDEDSPF